MAKLKLAPVPRSNAKNAYDLLRDVKKVILEVPKRYNQDTWKSKVEDYPANPVIVDRFPECGTVCCVAGWMTTLKLGREGVEVHSIEDVAAQMLGPVLGDNYSYDLFDSDAVRNLARKLGIPVPNRGTRDYARLGAKHIQNFMDKHKEALLAHHIN